MINDEVSTMDNCIFCKIVAGQIPSAKVYEDHETFAFLDIAPANKGHCLVVPKKHMATVEEAAPEALAAMMRAAKKVARAISSAQGNTAYNIVVNNGREAGQIVFHLHLHVIPRYADDELVIDWERAKRRAKYASGEIEQVRLAIGKFL
ncbi:MAG: Hit-like protein involved in cell-cycle regulation [archaeon GW2011_AR11]|nr:MAG: Hit-like protein involved in cell-cycle regulation [archaeon GW2011_AR11]